MADAEGFEYTVRGDAARDFLREVESTDPQLFMAKATGSYKRGNERAAKMHPRNLRRFT